MEDLKNKDKYEDEEKLEARKLAKELETMSEEDMQKMRWIMQGMKIARG